MELEWTRETMLRLLETSDKAVERAIVAIYNRQTTDEQISGDTFEHNGIGFSACHAQSGSYYAEYVLRGNRLTDKHLDKARSIAKHYVKQLLVISQGKTFKVRIQP